MLTTLPIRVIQVKGTNVVTSCGFPRSIDSVSLSPLFGVTFQGYWRDSFI